MIYILVGENWFGVRARLQELTAAFVSQHTDLAVEKIDADEATPERIQGAIEALPFLTTKKMVVVYHLSAHKDAAEQLEQLSIRADEITELIIVEAKLDKRSTYYKTLKKSKGFEEFNELDETGMQRWLSDHAKQKKAELSPADARYLIERVGLNQTALATELEKLTQYDPNITKQTIDLLTEQTPSSSIFNMVDAAFSGNLRSALKLYDEQRAQRVEPQAIHGMLVWQMNMVATCAAAGDRTVNEIAADTKLSPFVLGKSQTIARHMGRQKISEFLKLLRDVDYASKHQTYDYDQAIRYAITSLAQ